MAGGSTGLNEKGPPSPSLKNFRLRTAPLPSISTLRLASALVNKTRSL